MERFPEYDCRWAEEKIKIDGCIDDAAWREAQKIELLLTDTAQKPDNLTEVRLLWDNDYLYASFFCQDTEVWGTITQRDGNIYDEEVVEIFIDADCDGKSYIEIEVSPRNVLFDAYILNPGQRDKLRVLRDWDSDKILHAVSIDGELNSRNGTDRSWSCEIAIPFEDIITAPSLPPLPDDEWRVNLYRIDHTRQKSEYSAWSPTGELDFHIPSRFGRLRFCG